MSNENSDQQHKDTGRVTWDASQTAAAARWWLQKGREEGTLDSKTGGGNCRLLDSGEAHMFCLDMRQIAINLVHPQLETAIPLSLTASRLTQHQNPAREHGQRILRSLISLRTGYLQSSSIIAGTADTTCWRSSALY